MNSNTSVYGVAVVTSVVSADQGGFVNSIP